MPCVAIRHDASMHTRGRIVTERTGTDEKRIRVGRVLHLQGKKHCYKRLTAREIRLQPYK